MLTVYLKVEPLPPPCGMFVNLVTQISRVTSPKIDLLVCLKYV